MAQRVLIVAFLLASASAAAAQSNHVSAIAPAGAAVDDRPQGVPDFRMPLGDLRETGAPRRNGLIAAMPLGDRVMLGVGRFRVGEIARPATHVEPAHRSADIRRRDRGIAAVGVSLRF